MAINSRQKGARAEREVAKILRESGFPEARRGQQFSGANGDADVVGLPGVHLEIKHVERLDLYGAWDQSVRDSQGMEIPWVVHRKNNRPWLCTMSFEEALLLYRLAGLDNGDLSKCTNVLLDGQEDR